MLDFAEYSREIGAYASFGSVRKILPVGQTSVSNTDLLDSQSTGRGILRDIWTDPNLPFRGTYFQGESDCMTFVEHLITGGRLGGSISMNPEFVELLDLYQRYVKDVISSNSGLRVRELNVGLRYRRVISQDANENKITLFPVNSEDATVLPATAPTTENVAGEMYDDVVNSDGSRTPIADPNTEDLFTRSAAPEYRALMSPFAACQRSIRARAGCTTAPSVDDIALGRIKSVTSMIAMSTKAAAQAAGIAGGALAAAFVILDFVDGNWKGAAIGALVSLLITHRRVKGDC